MAIQGLKAALWLRVSKGEQNTQNQLMRLNAEADRRGLTVVETFDTSASAFTGKQEAMLTRLVDRCAAGAFDYVLMVALDRLDRRGPLSTLAIVDRLLRTGVTLVSLRESWLEQGGPMASLLLSITAWVSEQESSVRSERIRAGLERRKANGLPVGRQPGSKDKQRRKRSGYVRRYEAA